MRVLITGAAGFLGRHFARVYAQNGDDVIAVDDFSSPWAFWPENLGEIIDADMLEAFDGLSGPFDVAFHFAAPVGGREKIEHDPLFNAHAFALDEAFFRRANARVLVYPSSSAVYGVGRQAGRGQPLTEDLVHPTHATIERPDSMYGLVKVVGECMAYDAARLYDRNVLCIRPFSGYGEDQSPEYPMPSIVMRAVKHEDPLVVWGSGSQRRDFIHVDDLVAATLARLHAGVVGYQNMNIGSGVPVSFIQVASMAAEAAEYAPDIKAEEWRVQGVDSRYCDPSQMLEYHVPVVSLKMGITRMVGALSKEISLG